MAEKWISFDCYGTLVNWRTGLRAALDTASPGNGAALLALHRQVEGEIEAGPYRPYRDVLRQSLLTMAERAGVTVRSGHDDDLAATLPDWPFYPDTAPGLAQLRADGWKLAILSNIDRSLMAETLTHLTVPIDLVITAEDVGSYKPRPAHLERLISKTGLDPSRWVHAAVNLEYDLIPAAALGAATIWVNRDREPQTEFPLFAEVGSVGELPAAVPVLP